ncbi:hypothetical protein [Thermogutta sp.]|uniref:anti-sigma factor n=1 Tax=Thermogutta sp. TaxID=1962930 RepID=UPI003C7C4B52
MTRSSPDPSDAAVRLEALREDLVAYLDGELSAEEAARIERLINEDPEVRSELQRLAETWDWLNVLERPTVDEDFTRTTIEMVARSAVSEIQEKTESRRKSFALFAAVGVLGTIVCLLVGYAIAFSLWTNPNQWLLEHYAVIQNQDLYRHVESVRFLRMLKENGLFVEDEELPPAGPEQPVGLSANQPPTTMERRDSDTVTGNVPPKGDGTASNAPYSARTVTSTGPGSVNPAVEDLASATAPGKPGGNVPTDEANSSKSARDVTESKDGFPKAAADSTSSAGMPRLVMISDPTEARHQIEAMTDAEKYELQQKVERFKQLPATEQKRMMQLHEELIAAPDAAELATVLVRYYQWFKLLTPVQRGEMEALRPDERIAWIRRTRSEMVTAAINRTLFNFPPERIRQLLEASMTSRPEDRPAPEDVFVLVRFVEETASKRGEDLLERLSPQERQNLVSKLNQLRDPQQKKELLAITWLQWQLDHPDQSSMITPQELDELLTKFSPLTRSRLEALPREEQLKRVSQWIRGSVFFRYVMPRVWADMRRPVSEQELSRFVEEQLSQEERAELLALPPEEMQRELTRRYLRWRYPGVGMGWHFRGRGGDRKPLPGADARPEPEKETPVFGPPGPGFGPPGQPPRFSTPSPKPQSHDSSSPPLSRESVPGQ